MDYLCDLPHDSARRKALSALPPTLNATYERILRRVNASNRDVQTLVSRALRWIIHQKSWYDMELSTAALCEAVSVNIGDSRRDLEAICDESDILRWCSSLVRKSADGDTIELAHFTVKEFLLQLQDEDTGEFAVYRIGPGHDEIELAKVCLTYLNFQDFNQGGDLSLGTMESRGKEYPFRTYAVLHWFDYAKDHLDDPGLFTLVTELLSPSKPNNLISWAQDYLAGFLYMSSKEKVPLDLTRLNAAIAESSALHYAALLALPKICKWLIDRGCDVNRGSLLGTPLHCGLSGHSGLLFDNPFRRENARSTPEGQSVILVLLEEGADPNEPFIEPRDAWSPLAMSICSFDYVSTVRILQKGARLDEHCLTLLEETSIWFEEDEGDADNISIILRHIDCEDLEAHPRLIDEFRPLIAPQKSHLKNGGHLLRNDESSLRVAARLGQAEVVKQLLREHKLDPQVVDNNTGLTALHYAVMSDQIEVVKILLGHGSHVHEKDHEGKTAVHHASERNNSRCLRYFLENHTGSSSTGVESVTGPNTATYKDHEPGDTLVRSATSTLAAHIGDLKTKDGRSPLLCAASTGSTDNIELLLRAGCTVADSADDGSTALHHAAKSHSVEAIQLLLDNGSEIRAVTKIGFTVLHYALLELTDGFCEAVEILIDSGVDPCKACEKGRLPIHLLIGDGENRNYNYCRDWERKSVMSTLVSLIFEASAEGPNIFNEICQLKPLSESDWLLTMFNIFLDKGADLAITDKTGQSALQSLTTVWLDCCSQWSRYRSFMATSAKMMQVAMDHVPLDGPLNAICTDPKLAKMAVMKHDEDLAFKFLKHSPDVDMKIENSSIIETACVSGCSSRLLQNLLARSIISTNDQQHSRLVALCCKANTPQTHDLVQVLVELGHSPNDAVPTTGTSPIMFAASLGEIGIMELLVSKGANLNQVDNGGSNVVHHACAGGQQESLWFLRNTEVDWNGTGEWLIRGKQFVGVTPLHLAAQLPDSHLLEYLLDEGLAKDANAVAGASVTALWIAAWLSLPQNVSTLLKRNADSMIKAYGDETPLHVAIRCGHEAVLAVFLEFECDVRALDKFGLDCEMTARKYGHSDLAKKIRDYREEQGMYHHSKQAHLLQDDVLN